MKTTMNSATSDSSMARRPWITSRDLYGPMVVAAVLVAASTVTLVFSFGSLIEYPLSLFSFAVSSTGLPFVYPLLAVVAFVLPFGGLLSHRWVFLARPRTSIRRFLVDAAVKNAVLSFLGFFVGMLVVFVLTYFVAPALGYPIAGVQPGEVVPSPAGRARMTELVAVSPVLYGIAYAAWSGLNAAVWASIGFAALLITRSRVVALVAPLAVVFVLTFALLLGDQVARVNNPLEAWMLFGVAQQSFLPTALYLLGYALLAAAIVAATIRRSDRLPGLR